jgi:cell division protease FtsH
LSRRRKEMLDTIAVTMAGRIAEEIVSEDISSGAVGDIQQATSMARAMVTQHAMSPRLGLATFEQRRALFVPNDSAAIYSKVTSEKTAQAIDESVREILDQAFAIALKCIRDERRFIEDGVAQLLRAETLDEGEIVSLWKMNRVKIAPVQARLEAN